jgi:hypothetical protein
MAPRATAALALVLAACVLLHSAAADASPAAAPRRLLGAATAPGSVSLVQPKLVSCWPARCVLCWCARMPANLTAPCCGVRVAPMTGRHQGNSQRPVQRAVQQQAFHRAQD